MQPNSEDADDEKYYTWANPEFVVSKQYKNIWIVYMSINYD